MKHTLYQHVGRRTRGRPPLSTRVYIEPVHVDILNLERLAEILIQHAKAIRGE